MGFGKGKEGGKGKGKGGKGISLFSEFILACLYLCTLVNDKLMPL